MEIQEEPCYKQKSFRQFVMVGCYCSFVAFVIVMSWAMSCKERAIRDELNKQPGFISEHMSRKVITPRVDLEQNVLRNSITYFQEGGTQWSDCEWDIYWNEEGKVDISQKAEKELMEATF